MKRVFDSHNIRSNRKEEEPLKNDAQRAKMDKYADLCSEGLAYAIDRRTREASVVMLRPTMQTACVVVPSSVEHEGITYRVTSIGGGAFMNMQQVTEIIISEGVTQIGAWAFADCESLRSITIPDGVTRIEKSTFSGCKRLSSVTLPKTLEYIGNYAFWECKALESVVLPEGLKKIAHNAFDHCSGLTSIELPNSLTRLGSWAFNECSSLRSANIPPRIHIIRRFTFSGCKALVLTIPDHVRWIQWAAFMGCEQMQQVSIPKRTFLGLVAFDESTKIIRRTDTVL